MTRSLCLETISDRELLTRLHALASESRRVEAKLIAHLAEVDRRKLHLGQACSSLYVYCTKRLGFSEGQAYLRIRAARASRRFPQLLGMLAEGRIHLTAIKLLAPHLTGDNCAGVLARAEDKSKQAIEMLVAELAPKPDVAESLRRLPRQLVPEPGREDTVSPVTQCSPASGPTCIKAPTPVLVPLAPARYKLQLTAGAELHDKLLRLRALMRHKVPDGDLATLLDIAVTEKLQRLEARQLGKTQKPRKPRVAAAAPATRHIPAEVKRAVVARDQNQCAFVNDAGERCAEREGLEFHHIHPHGKGGPPTTDNIAQMCRPHNQYLAECDYGAKLMARYLHRPARAREPGAIYTLRLSARRASPCATASTPARRTSAYNSASTTTRTGSMLTTLGWVVFVTRRATPSASTPVSRRRGESREGLLNL